MGTLCMMGWTYRMGAATLEEFLKVPEPEWVSSFGDASEEPFVFLSTCNRIEFYFVCKGSDDSRFSFLDGKLMDLSDLEAIDHLFRVACGLDSLSVGEGEVLGQVKRAFGDYLKRGVKDHILNEVFNAAIRTGKAVRERTRISAGKVVAIYQNGSFLFIVRARREGDPWSGNIAFPGGFIKPHESS
ncbi:MAG: hypothetical protein M1454_00500, partial [Candidatus Thermoplasmatota archaeon]|nr:hypothetical protein [Candidatus Thermoplasmatota archaeon]